VGHQNPWLSINNIVLTVYSRSESSAVAGCVTVSREVAMLRVKGSSKQPILTGTSKGKRRKGKEEK
jgi:hypothetical protein